MLSRILNARADRQAPAAEAVRDLNAFWDRIVPRRDLGVDHNLVLCPDDAAHPHFERQGAGARRERLDGGDGL